MSASNTPELKMVEGDRRPVDETYRILHELVQATERMRADWERLDAAGRDKAWWQVHKASREVWNLIHPAVRRD